MGDGRWRTLFVTTIIRSWTNLHCPNTWDPTKASHLMKRSFCASCITATWLQVWCFSISLEELSFPLGSPVCNCYGTTVQLKWLNCATGVQLVCNWNDFTFGACCATRLSLLCKYTMSCMQKLQSVFKKVQLGVHFLWLSSVPTRVLLLCSWMCAFVQLKKGYTVCFCIMQDVWCM